MIILRLSGRVKLWAVDELKAAQVFATLKKMTILLATDHYLPTINGIAIHVDLLAKELRRRGHTVYILTAYCPGQELSEFLIPAPSLPLLGRGDERLIIPFSPKTIRHLRKIDFDIVHDHLFLTTFLSRIIVKEKSLPHLVTYHTIFIYIVKRTFPFLPESVLTKLSNNLERWYFNQFDQILAPSQKAVDAIRAGSVKTPVIKFHNGIATLKPKQNKTYPWYDPKNTYIALTGRVDSTKNVRMALDAFKELSSMVDTAYLVIIGDGPGQKPYKTYVKELGVEKKVIFFGKYQLAELLTIYQYIDIAFFTSIADTLSTVAIEQAVAGLPFVVVDDPGVTEIAQPSVNAIATENDAHKLAQALKKLIDDKPLREKYGKESIKIGKEFTIQSFGDRIEKMYQGLQEKKANSLGRNH